MHWFNFAAKTLCKRISGRAFYSYVLRGTGRWRFLRRHDNGDRRGRAVVFQTKTVWRSMAVIKNRHSRCTFSPKYCLIANSRQPVVQRQSQTSNSSSAWSVHFEKPRNGFASKWFTTTKTIGDVRASPGYAVSTVRRSSMLTSQR